MFVPSLCYLGQKTDVSLAHRPATSHANTTHKLEQADVLPQGPDAARESQCEHHHAHHQDQHDRVDSMQPGHLREVGQHALKEAEDKR